MRGILSLLLAFSVGTFGCLSSCDGVLGGGVDSVLADPVDSVLSPPVDDGEEAPAVVGIDWPEGGAYGTIEILFEPAKETTYVNADPMPTLTNFGALTLSMAQANATKQPQFQDPCGAGPAIPCMYLDGGDDQKDSGGVRSTLKFLHDGTGSSCYFVMEVATGSAANGYVFTTQASSTNAGYRFSHNNSSPPRWVSIIGNGSASIIASLPGTGTGVNHDVTAAEAVVHGTARTSDFFWEKRGVANTGQSDYSAAVSTSNPAQALTVGSIPAETVGWTTSYFFAGICYSAIHTATEIAGVWAAIEAETGALPQ